MTTEETSVSDPLPETTETFMDKPWGDGPWQTEPDRVEWRDDGIVCLALRQHFGVWCGYVGVPDGHPWHGKQYTDDALDGVTVHGGLTYADACMVDHTRADRELICHVPLPGEPEHLWWLGFDCGHGFDVTPRYVSEWEDPMGSLMRELSDSFDGMGGENGQTYRTIDYVRAEITSLAAQAKAA